MVQVNIKNLFVCLMASCAALADGHNMTNMTMPHIASMLNVQVAASNNYGAGITNWTTHQGADWGFTNNFTISLAYSGAKNYTDNKWALYFHFIRRALSCQDERFEVTQVTGDLTRIVPTDKFMGFMANQTGYVTIPIVTEYWMQFKTDFFPRYFVVDHTGVAMAIKNADTMDIAKFAAPVTPKVFKRSAKDLNIYQTGPVRYLNNDQNAIKIMNVTHNIIPTPVKVEILSKMEMASIAGGIRVSGELPKEQLEVLNGRATVLGFKPMPKAKHVFNIKVHIQKSKVAAPCNKADGYTLKISTNGAVVYGYDVAGAFYGVQSILGLTTIGETQIPLLEITDAPRFHYRAQHADISRNFHIVATLERALEQMSVYKLNKFLLHASDDEGWRVEIPGLPELTDLGSKRCWDPSETKCLVPQLGSGPYMNNSGTGHLTYKDYIDLVKYAHARNIELIPEFDMPGHARAAVMSMELRYHKTNDSSYRLVDPLDTTKLATVQYFNRLSLLNPCQPSVIKFVSHVMKQISIAHEMAGAPLRRWSFGGDEAKNAIIGVHNVAGPMPTNRTGDVPLWVVNNTVGINPLWREEMQLPFMGSPVCRKFMAENNITNSNEMTGNLAMRVAQVAKKMKIENFQTWQSALSSVNQSQFPMQTSSMDWDALFWGSNFQKWANKGFKVISACADFTYFDQPYEPNPYNRGFYWASLGTSMYRVFSFAPVNIPQNAEVGVSRLNHTYSLPSPSLSLNGENRTAEEVVLGMQGNIWSETIWDHEAFDYMLYPRMLALAERAWHQGKFELPYTVNRTFIGGNTTFVNQTVLKNEYNTFINIVGQREMKKLERGNVMFRVPSVGAKVVNGTLKCNNEIPTTMQQYSIGTSNVWHNITGDVKMNATSFIMRAMSPNGMRHGIVANFTCETMDMKKTDRFCHQHGCNPKYCTYVPIALKSPTVCKSLIASIPDSFCAKKGCPALGTTCEWVTL